MSFDRVIRVVKCFVSRDTGHVALTMVNRHGGLQDGRLAELCIMLKERTSGSEASPVMRH
jgi:hypothetical protein